MWEKCLAREVVQMGAVVGFGGFGAGGGGLFCFLSVFCSPQKVSSVSIHKLGMLMQECNRLRDFKELNLFNLLNSR